MKYLIKIEKALFYFLSAAFFWQLRLIWMPAGRQFNEWASFYLYATDILILVILILWLARDFKGIKDALAEEINFKKPEVILGLFLLICALSAIIANKRELGFYGFLKTSELALFFLYVKSNFSKLFNWEYFWQIFIVSAALQSLVAVSQFFRQKSLGLKFFAESPLGPDIAGAAKIVVNGQKIVRAYGLVPHPNILAAILMLAIFGLAFLFIRQYQSLNIYKKIFFGLVSALLSLGLFLTFSRGVLLVGLFLLACWLISFFWDKKYKRPAMIALTALVIVNCLWLTVFWRSALVRFNPNDLAQTQAVKMRVFYNDLAFSFIKVAPILGIGPRNFVAVFSEPFSDSFNWLFQPVHNIYLLMAAELGVGGFLAFGWFLSALWLRAREKNIGRPENFLSYIFYFIILTAFFDHFWWDLQQGQILFWLMLGLLSARSSMDPEQNLPS